VRDARKPPQRLGPHSAGSRDRPPRGAAEEDLQAAAPGYDAGSRQHKRGYAAAGLEIQATMTALRMATPGRRGLARVRQHTQYRGLLPRETDPRLRGRVAGKEGRNRGVTRPSFGSPRTTSDKPEYGLDSGPPGKLPTASTSRGDAAGGGSRRTGTLEMTRRSSTRDQPSRS